MITVSTIELFLHHIGEKKEGITCTQGNVIADSWRKPSWVASEFCKIKHWFTLPVCLSVSLSLSLSVHVGSTAINTIHPMVLQPQQPVIHVPQPQPQPQIITIQQQPSANTNNANAIANALAGQKTLFVLLWSVVIIFVLMIQLIYQSQNVWMNLHACFQGLSKQ